MRDSTTATIEGMGIKVVKVTKAYNSDLFNAAGLTDSAVIWQQPANTKLLNAKLVLDVKFVATDMTDLDVTIGDAGDNDGILAGAMNLVSDAANTQYKEEGAYLVSSPVLPQSAAKDWTAYATAVGANLSTLTAGQVSFYFAYIQR